MPKAGPSASSELRLDELLERLAAPTPAPGGGSATAWACALSAGLVEMAARIGGLEQPAARAAELRSSAVALAEAELHTFEPVLEALRLARENPGRPARLDRALSEASETPLQIARVAAELAGLGLDVAVEGKQSVEGDALAGMNLAAGACQAAARLVQMNLAGQPDDPRHAEAARLRRGARSVADRGGGEL